MKRWRRVGVALVSLVVPACGGMPDDGDDAGRLADATSRADSPDAAPSIDVASGDDAPVTEDSGIDAMTVPDASWGPCSYGGVMGVCESTSLCTGGSMPMAGLCPGPADIQCCLPTPDGGSSGMIMPSDVLARLGACTRIGGDYATDYGGSADIPICQTANVVWWRADMDIDCDGGHGATCMSDPDYMFDTSAVDSSGSPLDASTLPFIVIPLPSSRWRYADHGIELGQVALVIYNGRMQWGIFGDEGPSSVIGEASFAMAESLGIPSSPTSGGVDSGVTYVVFTGVSARVTRNEDHAEAVSVGTPLLHAFVGM